MRERLGRVATDTKRMKKTLAAAVACAALLAPAALADVNGSIQQLSTDASSVHATLLADGQKLLGDIQSLQGTKDRAAAKTLLSTDLQKLKADLQSGHSTLQADRSALQADLQALKGTKPGKDAMQQTRQALQQLRASLQSERQDVKSSNDSVRQALAALRASFKK
jgi:chromosome segregation ATPase